MTSYLSGSAPSRTEGSYGKVKVQPGLRFGDGILQIIADEINRALDDLVNVWKTVGAANSGDPNSHEYRLNRLEEFYPGFVEDFVFVELGAMPESVWLDDIGTAGSRDNSIADAVGVGRVQAAGATEVGWGGKDAIFDLQSTEMKVRMRVSALPGTSGDYFRIGLWKDSNNRVEFWGQRTAAWQNWVVWVYSGGVPIATDSLTVPPAIGEWHTFKIRTTATGVTFIYDEGESTEQSKTLSASMPSGKCDPRSTFRSNSGSEYHYTDYIRCHSTVAYK